MSYDFVNRPAVKIDIMNAVDYYKNINVQIAKHFLFRLKEAKEYIANTPFGFEIKYKNTRTILLKKFPYHLHYLVDEANKTIIILAIINAYKNPKDYSTR